MSILAAILLLSASGHAERSMETDASIGRIVAQCAKGAFDDLATKDTMRRLREAIGSSGGQRAWPVPTLRIDGEPRAGLQAWGQAAWRVGGYVADVRTAGSVDIACRLRLGRRTVVTSTAVSDGRVVKVIDAWWTETVQVTKRITRRVPIHVTITIRASETAEGTLLVGEARGYADTSDFHCRGVRFRIAEPQATASLNAGLRDALRTIERGGRQFYAGGADIAGALDKVKLGIKIGGVVGRLRR